VNRPSSGEGAIFIIGIERGIDLAAGLGKDELAQQIRPLLRGAERDMPAAGMAHQVDRAGVQLFDKGDEIVDMLRDRIGGALAVPMIGEKVPQADADQAMLCRQRPGHAAPDAEVIQGTVHADQRRTFRLA
jgi:hypothetical protein